jgi:hypothetical protein
MLHQLMSPPKPSPQTVEAGLAEYSPLLHVVQLTPGSRMVTVYMVLNLQQYDTGHETVIQQGRAEDCIINM